jgi:hypothetical protein
MHEEQLLQLLDEDTFTPGSVTAVASLCDDWFGNEGSLASFVFRSIFRELVQRDWAEQAVPTAVFSQFRDAVLPRLRAALQHEADTVLLVDLVRAYRDIAAP